MGFISSKKNKRYNYKPQYFEKDGDGSQFEIKHKFDGFRKTVGSQGGIKSRFNSALDEFEGPSDVKANKRIYIIIAVLILLFLVFIDFDISIFFPK